MTDFCSTRQGPNNGRSPLSCGVPKPQCTFLVGAEWTDDLKISGVLSRRGGMETSQSRPAQPLNTDFLLHNIARCQGLCNFALGQFDSE